MKRRQRQLWPSVAVLVALLLSLSGGAGAHQHPAASGAHRSGVLTGGVVAAHTSDPAMIGTPRLTVERGSGHPQALVAVYACASPHHSFRIIVADAIALARTADPTSRHSRAPPSAQL